MNFENNNINNEIQKNLKETDKWENKLESFDNNTKNNWENKLESLGNVPEKWEDKLEPINLSNQLKESIEENISKLKNDINLLNDEKYNLATEESDLKIKILKNDVKASISEIKDKLVQEFENTYNYIIELLNSMGLKIDKIQLDKTSFVEKLESTVINQIDEAKLNITEHKKDDLLNKLNDEKNKLSDLEKKLGILDKYSDSFDKEFNDYLSSKELSPNQIKELDKEFQKLYNKIEEFNLDKQSSKELISEINNQIKEIIENVENSNSIDLDYFSIFKETLLSASIQAGVGAVIGAKIGAATGPGALATAGIGALAGAITGATGEITRQYLIQKGADNSTATMVQTGVEVAGGALGGLGIAGAVKNVGKASINVGKNIAKKSKDINPIEYVKDSAKAIGYETKGLLNDIKIHNFIDGKGKPFQAKISDVVDLGRTIKMEYVGSLKPSNSAGFLRDYKYFSKKYLENFPETLSKNNVKLIEARKAPIVDKQWIEFNPNHKSFLGQKLEHHHLNNTGIAVYIPRDLHNKGINHDAFHVDSKSILTELSEVAKQKLNLQG